MNNRKRNVALAPHVSAPDVDYEATGGTINPAGLYIAGMTSGNS